MAALPRKLARAGAALMAAWAWAPLAIAQASAPSAPVAEATEINLGDAGARIEPDIFGQFSEHLGSGIYGGIWVGPGSAIPNVRGIRSDVVTALRQLHVPNVRWPGGCYADEYHWRSGIGPAAARRITRNTSWGGTIEPGSFGTHEYMDLLAQIGARAFVSVNIGSGTPAEAADWLEYMTAPQPVTLASERAANGHPAPYEVAILGLGNESWGCGGSMSAEHYIEEMKRYARFVRNQNPAQAGARAMKRIAVGWDGGASDYTEAILKAWRAKDPAWDIEGISMHFYAVGEGWPPHLAGSGFGERDYALLLRDAFQIEQKVAAASALMQRHDPQGRLMLAVDEWGVWLEADPAMPGQALRQQNSMRDAMAAAIGLDSFIRHADRVRLANLAQMTNVLQAMVLTDGPKMLVTPSYHVFRMYVPFQNARQVALRFEAGTVDVAGIALPRFDAVAARDDRGRLLVAITNVDPTRPARIALNLPGGTWSKASGEVLAAARIDSINTFADPRAVEPRRLPVTLQAGRLLVELPPHAVGVLEVEP